MHLGDNDEKTKKMTRTNLNSGDGVGLTAWKNENDEKS